MGIQDLEIDFQAENEDKRSMDAIQDENFERNES